MLDRTVKIVTAAAVVAVAHRHYAQRERLVQALARNTEALLAATEVEMLSYGVYGVTRSRRAS